MRNSIITIVVTLFFSLLSSSAFFSQTATISGNVYDSQDSEFLIGVNIFNENNIGTITDVDGNFSLKLPLGKQKIIFKYIGYQRVVREVFLKSNDSVKIEVALNSITNQIIQDGPMLTDWFSNLYFTNILSILKGLIFSIATAKYMESPCCTMEESKYHLFFGFSASSGNGS